MVIDLQSSQLSTGPKRHQFPWRFFLIIFLAAAGIFWLVHTHSGKTATQTAASGGKHGGSAGGGPQSVAVVTAQKGSIPITVSALGTVTPLATVTVRTQIAGQLTQVAFREGQIVKAGDFLAQVDPRPYQLQLEQAQGALQRDEGLLADAQRDLTRYQILVAQDSISRQQLDTQEATVQQDIGAVAIDKAQIDTAKLNLIYCHITAPISGRIGLRQVDTGNYVQTSDVNGIVVIAQTEPISVLYSVPEDNIPAIMTRIAAGAQLTATAYDRAFAKVLATGVLETVDNVIDTSTGTVKIRANFDNKNDLLFPNQFVNVQLLVDTLQNVIVLPVSAIQHGTPGTFVYVVKPDNTVTVTKITTGPSQGENIAVLSGLDVGQIVVSDGADKLKEGAKVILPGQSPATTNNAPADGAPAKGHHRHNKASSSGDNGSG